MEAPIRPNTRDGTTPFKKGCHPAVVATRASQGDDDDDLEDPWWETTMFVILAFTTFAFVTFAETLSESSHVNTTASASFQGSFLLAASTRDDRRHKSSTPFPDLADGSTAPFSSFTIAPSHRAHSNTGVQHAAATGVPWRKRDFDGHPTTVRDTCSEDSFGASMERVGVPPERRAAVAQRYRSFLDRTCPQDALVIKECGSCDFINVVNGNSSNAAMLKGRPFIINAGEGTTGLRFIQTFLAGQGIGAARNRMKHGHMIIENRTGYLSDTPVSRSLWQLITAYPDALVMLTLRDSIEWRKSRIDKHEAGHRNEKDKWYQAAPCGESDHAMDHSDVSTTYDVYNTWVACMMDPTGDSAKFTTVNVYNTENSVLESDLLSFLADSLPP